MTDANVLFRLAIRYDLRTSGMHTIDKAQVIENKCGRLQKLIEMFEHQADSHLLRHKALDNVPITLLTDYSEFDDVDMLDDSGSQTSPQSVSPPILRFSDESSVNQINAEDLSILLPSSLGWGWCVDHHLQALAEKEAKLRIAQANDAIHSMRLALGFKSACSVVKSELQILNRQRREHGMLFTALMLQYTSTPETIVWLERPIYGFNRHTLSNQLFLHYMSQTFVSEQLL